MTVKWLSVASLAIEDGKTQILFDPSWTRPKLKHWLNIEKFRSDEKLVQEIVKGNDLRIINAVFSSHSHFDHVVDAPTVSKITGAIFYTDESSERIARAYQDQGIQTSKIKAGVKIQVGNFQVTPIRRDHPPVLGLFEFLPGPVPKDFSFSLWDYHAGDTWFYLIEHPEGNLLIDQGAASHVTEIKSLTQKVDVLIQGVANRTHDDQILQGYLKSFHPKVFIPVHFDNFFYDLEPGGGSDLPGMALDEILSKIRRAYPSIKSERPKFGEKIRVLEIQ